MNLPADAIEAAARAALDAPGAKVADSRVEPVEYPAWTPSTAALERAWVRLDDDREATMFVKTIQSLRHWAMLDVIPPERRDALISTFPWRVEAELYGGPPPQLPDGIRMPRIYRIDDLGDDRIRLWLENVATADMPWDVERYRAAARLLGRLAALHILPGPDRHSREQGFLRGYFGSRIAIGVVPALQDEAMWRHPLLAALDPALRTDLLALADEAPAILDQLDGLPWTLAHGDACPQNLLAPTSSPESFVAIDWGMTGPHPIGFDAAQLLAGRADSGDLDTNDLPALDEAITEAYVGGLADGGADLSAADIRAGYLGSLLLRSAFTSIPIERLREPPTPELVAFFERRGRYARFLLGLRSELSIAAPTGKRPG